MSAQEIPESEQPIGRVSESGGVYTLEDKEKIFARRERAVKLRSMGMPIAEIARQNGVSWGTARDDLEKHLRALAKMSTTVAHRQLIGEIFLRSILTAEKLLGDLSRDPGDPARLVMSDEAASELKLKCVDRIQRAADSLLRTYGLMGPNPIIIPDAAVQLNARGLVFEGIDPQKIDANKVRELREKFIDFMQSMQKGKAVDASFTLEGNGHPPANGDDQPKEGEGS